MKLYTILLHFSDWTTGIEQYNAKSPEDALFMFIEKAESLEGFNRKKITNILHKRNNLLIHMANELKGFWIMDFGTNLIDVLEFSGINGGFIIQTDSNGPIRYN